MTDTIVQIERPPGAVVAASIPAQYEIQGTAGHIDENRQREFINVRIFIATEFLNSITPQRGDMITDMKNIDSLTGTNVKLYVTLPLLYEDHMEIMAEQIRGD